MFRRHAGTFAAAALLLLSVPSPVAAFVAIPPAFRASSTSPRVLLAEPSSASPEEAAEKRRKVLENMAANPKLYELHPNVRKAIFTNKENRRRAKESKRRREPASVKKRRLLLQYKQSAAATKRAAYIERAVPREEQFPLESLSRGDAVNAERNATVISLTPFGAYVDIGCEIDGLLHVRDMSASDFISHPRELFTSGDKVDLDLLVKYVDPAGRRLAFSAVPLEDESAEEEEDRIRVEDVHLHDELWGEIAKVTAYGAFVEIGTEVEGFLHFMDHPDHPLYRGEPPRTFMAVGERVRVWAADVDVERNRIKLTAVRPTALPLLGRL
uniref:S1 motif domain-containing protein n=1 Tax=Corethron hystrix TaxID=216773 RepID=A0A7S1BMA4_9STRA|mmetsp:Transcript_33744/g.77890  ORF Transcript_33744/g.77890 Transcript_33744/m.77890 type:complete len:327 (+) Transcript_33744:67-1047(+)